jgi:hypothetical protein
MKQGKHDAAIAKSAPAPINWSPPDSLTLVVGGNSLNFVPHERQKLYPGDTFAPHFRHLSLTVPGIIITLFKEFYL